MSLHERSKGNIYRGIPQKVFLLSKNTDIPSLPSVPGIIKIESSLKPVHFKLENASMVRRRETLAISEAGDSLSKEDSMGHRELEISGVQTAEIDSSSDASANWEEDITTPISWQRHVLKGTMAVGGLALATVVAISFLPESLPILAIGSKVVLGISGGLIALSKLAPLALAWVTQNHHMVAGALEDSVNNNNNSNGGDILVGLTGGALSAASTGAGGQGEQNANYNGGMHVPGEGVANATSGPEGTYESSDTDSLFTCSTD